ncbi:hypothetical protein BV22DRAFT_1033838 [Leucogyrophana mollusca]|uniref:Uncharacterized protein n=1 Tax=Leucogyrophana mollusca TaxID=85980 RepID=A0ACB8BI75_9AGAM|nr:hypothetical protein BV22DRAFT_1033838 [Leucogyrophana mollusca]
MSTPQFFSTSLSSNEPQKGDRKNLDLRTRDGNIDAEIWLMPPGRVEDPLSGMEKKRTTLYLYSRDGYVSAKVNTVHPSAPFLLDIYARDGRVTVLLPRSFNGPLRLTARHGSVVLSDELQQRSALLSTAERTRRYFVGETFGLTEQDWQGDELKVEARDGKIRVRYIDEVETTQRGFLGRIFSR